PPVQFASPAAFCAAVDLVVLARASSAESRHARILPDAEDAWLLTHLTVTQTVRQSVVHPATDTVDVEQHVGRHDVGPEIIEYQPGPERPLRPAADYVLFLKWDGFRAAFYPYGGAAGIYEIRHRDTLITTSHQTTPTLIGTMSVATLVDTLRRDPT